MNKTNEKRVQGHVDSVNSSSVSAEFLPEPSPRRLTVALRQVWSTPARLALGGGILAAGLAGPALGQTLELSDLDGSNGFVINGSEAGDYAGFSVSNAGDVNGDEIDDIIIGVPAWEPYIGSFDSRAYVVFGSSTGFSSALELSALDAGDGSDGFVIRGGYHLGVTTSNAGDVNGDGFDDVLIGGNGTYTYGVGRYSGESYVVFGSSTLGPEVRLSTLDGRNGFILMGSKEYDFMNEVSSAGDVNGDGIDDIIIGAFGADPNGENSGQSYVVFGSSAGFSSALDLPALDGRNGFVINGSEAGDYAGSSVSNAGDINGDGLDDILISGGRSDYVVFGSSTGFDAVLELSDLDGHNGFVIEGSGVVSDAGDVNGDGFDDILIGRGRQTYVVFGSNTGFDAVLEFSDLDGHNGFVINNGWVRGSAGDVNGDGIDDILIGAFFTAPSDQDRVYVVFGSSMGFSPVLELSDLDGSNSFVINFSRGGVKISKAGDVNGDGLDDILISSSNADPNGNEQAGQAYVVFGKAVDGPGDPRVRLEDLIAKVKGLDIGQHSLINALNDALEAHAQDRLNRVAGRLKAFIRQVEALRGGEIAEGDADALIAEANEILDQLLSEPLGQLESLIAQIKEADIAKRSRHELLKDLDTALEALAKGRVNRAANLLEVFTFHVMVLGDGEISEADAGALITQAEALLEGLLSGPVASFENLIIKVKAAGLERRLEHNLVNDLNAAEKAFKRGRINRSANMLGVFIDHVAALRGSKIAPADANAFIAQAETILGGLR